MNALFAASAALLVASTVAATAGDKHRHHHRHHDGHYSSGSIGDHPGHHPRHGRRLYRDEAYYAYYGAAREPNCEVERDWDNGRYEVEIECDDD